MKFILVVVSFFWIRIVAAQKSNLKQTVYRAFVLRKDSNEVVFTMHAKIENGKQVLYVVNDKERIRITDIQQRRDSLFFNMPVFECSLIRDLTIIE